MKYELNSLDVHLIRWLRAPAGVTRLTVHISGHLSCHPHNEMEAIRCSEVRAILIQLKAALTPHLCYKLASSLAGTRLLKNNEPYVIRVFAYCLYGGV